MGKYCALILQHTKNVFVLLRAGYEIVDDAKVTILFKSAKFQGNFARKYIVARQKLRQKANFSVTSARE